MMVLVSISHHHTTIVPTVVARILLALFAPAYLIPAAVSHIPALPALPLRFAAPTRARD